MTLRAFIDAAALIGPGIDGWAELAREGWSPGEVFDPVPACLAPRQAKRLSHEIRLALSVAEKIGPVLPADAAWVFASSSGEGGTLNAILEALCEPDMLIQPLRFQNAVHNAASGQWSIAAGLKGPMTSIAAYDETAGAGLLKALMQVCLEERAVGLVVFDAPLPEPLREKRPMQFSLGAGLALLPERSDATIAAIEAAPASGAPSAARTATGQSLRASGNPAAALVPLLEQLSFGEPGTVLAGLSGGGALRLEICP